PFPEARFLRRRVAMQECFVEQVAADRGERRGDEPHEERWAREVLPEDAAEDEDDQQRGEMADDGEAEQQPQLFRLKRVVDQFRIVRNVVLAKGHAAPKAGCGRARKACSGSVTFPAWASSAASPSFS